MNVDAFITKSTKLSHPCVGRGPVQDKGPRQRPINSKSTSTPKQEETINVTTKLSHPCEGRGPVQREGPRQRPISSRTTSNPKQEETINVTTKLSHPCEGRGPVQKEVPRQRPNNSKTTPNPKQEEAITKFTYTEIKMGGEFRLTFYAPSQPQADLAAKAAYAEIERLEQIMSDYRPTSEIRQLKPNIKTRISDPLFEVISAAQQISQQTDGAFDITAGPAVKLWRNARNTGRLPGPIEVRQALKFVDYRQIQLDQIENSILISKPGFAIDLGGIAKGYACDAALDVLKQNQITCAIVQAGGDITIADPPPNQAGWQVQIPGDPNPQLFSNCAISTSGDTEQFIELNGIRYSHIVDPKTGIGLTNRVMSTVIADRGLLSDPFATALCVQGKGGITDLRKPK